MAKKTIWQTLNTVLDNEANPMSIEPNNKGDHGLFDVQNTEPREIIASSKEDLETKILTAQQQKYLGDQYKKIQTDRYQQSIYYESTRYASYMDFEAMEYFPEIASALDIMAEESTVLGEDGKMLQIRSDSDRIKNILEHLFYSILDVNSNLYFWIRNVLKYGDNFVFLKSDVKRGIIKAVQLKNLEIKRVEGDWFSNDTDATKLKTKFEWKQGGLVFQNFQIAHFRLIGDDKKLPYGTSVLEKSRKIWKQLSLAEDAMMVYRISRAPERRVFKIDVGSMDPADVTEYVKKVAAQFKKTTQVNQVNGQIDLRYNTLTQDEDYFIPVRNGQNQTVIDTLAGACLGLDTEIDLLDGRSLKLFDIIKEFETGKQLWSYSINPNSGEIVPGKITWAGITRKNTEVIKLTLDNGETIICTPDHKFPTKFNGTKEAKDLLINESLWSFNKEYKPIRNSKSEYEMVYDHNLKKLVYTHRLVANYMKKNNSYNEWTYSDQYINENKETIHHKDINRFNNNPENLIFMNSLDHYLYHSKNFINYSDLGGQAYKEKEIRYSKNINNPIVKLKTTKKLIEWNKNNEELVKEKYKKASQTKQSTENKLKRSFNSKKLWGYEEYRTKTLGKQTIIFNDNLLRIIKETYKENLTKIQLLELLNNNTNFIVEFIKINSHIVRKDFKGIFDIQHLNRILKINGYKTFKIFKESIPYFNHTIINIEWLTEKQDTGTITIDGKEELHNYHNFALSCGVFTKNSNLSDIGDISFLQNKLFAALRVPKTFLGFTEATGDGKNLSMQDVRFARTINRIQQAVLMELNKIAIIHLTLLGFASEWNNFSLALTNPSSQAEMLKLEILGSKITNFQNATSYGETGWAAMSITRAKKLILGMSEDEIVLDFEQQVLEKAESARNTPEQLLAKNISSGMFNDLYERYTDNGLSNNNSLEQPQQGGPSMSSGGVPPPMSSMNDIGSNPEELPNEPNAQGQGENGGELPNDINNPINSQEPNNSNGGNDNEELPTLKEDKPLLERNTLLSEEIKKNIKNINKLIDKKLI